MAKKIITLVILMIIIGSIAYWLYQPKSEEVNGIEGACLNSGGTISDSLCCQSVSDFPNLCLIGACGCSSDNSKQTKICDCGEGRCFDGKSCSLLQ